MPVRRLIPLMLAIAGLCWTDAARAVEVIVEGRAPMLGNDPDSARNKAIQQALVDATSQQGLYLDSELEMNHFRISVDRINLRTRARINAYDVLHAEVQAGEYVVTLRVDVEPYGQSGSCGQACELPSGMRILAGSAEEGWLHVEMHTANLMFLPVRSGELVQDIHRYAEAIQQNFGYRRHTLRRFRESLRSGWFVTYRVVETDIVFFP